MNTVNVLRELWRMRLAVAAIFALALGLATVATYRVGVPPQSRQYTVGVASARLLVDTPASQLVAVGQLGADTLPQRANIMSAVMAGGDAKAAIARHAGLLPDQLTAVTEATGTDGDTPSSAAGGYVLTTRILGDASGGSLPIIGVEARAPDVSGATGLIHAVIAGLNEHLGEQAALQNVSPSRRLRVSILDIVPGHSERRGPGLPTAVIVGLLTLLGGCGATLGVARLSRMLRDAGEPGVTPTASQAPLASVPTVPVAPRAARLESPAVAQVAVAPPPKTERAARERAIAEWRDPERIVSATPALRDANDVAAAPAVPRDVEPADAAERARDERSPAPEAVRPRRSR